METKFMALLDIKASQLRARESVELHAQVQQELATARAQLDDQDQSISALLDKNAKLNEELEESKKKTAKLIKQAGAKAKSKGPKEGEPVIIKNDKGEVAKEIHASKPKDQTTNEA
jgi:uncharacterized membrane-anchored protein YhcB (DUF1043 family)